jgi:hypothetical protein
VRRAALLALALLVLAGLAGCGGGSTSPKQQADKRAAQIQSRIEAAGYRVGGLEPDIQLTPAPEKALRIQVDFASPHSFTLTVLVYRTAAQARRFERIYQRECAAIPQCRKQGNVRRSKLIGTVVYSATSDDGRTPLSQARFDKIVRIAEGS